MPMPYMISRWIDRGEQHFRLQPINGAREQMPAPTYADEYLDYWADVYVGRKLDTMGICLLTFLACPHNIINSVDVIEAFRMQPLLPGQESVRQRLLLEEEIALLDRICTAPIEQLPGATCRNGSWVEPLHHHAHKRSYS